MKRFAIGLTAGVVIGSISSHLRLGRAMVGKLEPLQKLSLVLARRQEASRSAWRARPGDWNREYRYAVACEQCEIEQRALRIQHPDPANPPLLPSNDLLELEEDLLSRAKSRSQRDRAELLIVRARRVPVEIDRAMETR